MNKIEHYKLNTNNISIILGIFCVLMIFSILFQLFLVEPAHALTRYYNCVTRTADKNGTLSEYNIQVCYDKVFLGAVKAMEKLNNTN
ncbi:MAG: hypothetical protein DA328_09250 [Nitrososphaeraceae archaeon]|nr:hypothetical protein [Nitrososphaeraceae archaeon]